MFWYHHLVRLHHTSVVADIRRDQWRLPMVEERGQHVWRHEALKESVCRPGTLVTPGPAAS